MIFHIGRWGRMWASHSGSIGQVWLPSFWEVAGLQSFCHSFRCLQGYYLRAAKSYWLAGTVSEDPRFDMDNIPTVKPAMNAMSESLPRFFDRKPILLVDDNFSNLELFQFQLREFGLTSLPASDGRAAVDLITAHPSDYSLILMDMHMPDLDGLTATRIIRQHEASNGGHSIIIALTANALVGDREMCLTAGMDDYIAKPLSLKTLGRILEKWLVTAEEKEDEE
jgi:CheY-like chemotaxis protein